VPAGIVLADAGYGDDTAFREALAQWGLRCVMGVKSTTTLWAPGTEPLPPQPKSRTGRPPKLLRRGPGHQPVNAQELAPHLPRLAWRSVSWREGTHSALSSRFAARRVRAAHRDYWRAGLREEEWLLIEWPRAIVGLQGGQPIFGGFASPCSEIINRV
jgi:SRSO17 transposase